jgi:NADH-quinone oxidoreductase subunit N
MNVAPLLGLWPALPEVVLLGGACALMIVDLLSKDERRRLSFGFAQAVLALCLVATLFVIAASGGQRLYIFYGMFVSDLLSHVLKLFGYIAVSAALVYSRQYLRDRGLLSVL